MSHNQPATQVADHRQAGTYCLGCNSEIKMAERIVVCPRCGAAHHESCWQKGGCASYTCTPARHELGAEVSAAIVIGREDLDRATSPRMASPVARLHSPTMPGQSAPSLPNAYRQPMSRFAVVAFLVGLLGVPILGLMLVSETFRRFLPVHLSAVVLGGAAVLLGAIAIGHIQVKRRRGTLFAVCGVFVGLGIMVGWILVMAIVAEVGTNRVADLRFAGTKPDLAAIEGLPETIQRALRANVVVMSKGWGSFGQAIGSGVIVRIDRARAYILTNRHVVDASYPKNSDESDISKETEVQVEMLGQMPRKAIVHWYAPHGVDAALISTDLLSDEAVAAKWQEKNDVKIGSDIFGIGNPCDLAWTHTKGSVSQIRKQTSDNHEVSVIQTDVAISGGNSGGGLYDKQGFLIGINTWTTDKRIAEGLSFAISIDSIMALDPPIPGESKSKEEGQ